MAPCRWWRHPQPVMNCSSIEMTHSSWTPHVPRPLWVTGCCSKHTYTQHEHPTCAVAPGRWAAQWSRWSQVLPPVGHSGRLWRSYRLHRHGRGQITTWRNSNTFQQLQQHDCSVCEVVWTSLTSTCHDVFIPRHRVEHVGRRGGGRGIHSWQKNTQGNRCYTRPSS